MARKGMTGQLNMFDFFSSIEEGASGEVEMVSLMPGFNEQPEPMEEEPQRAQKKPAVAVGDENEKPVMSRTYEISGEKIEIAYLNYNKVRMTKGKSTPEIQSFESSKDAVDYYVKLMHSYELEDE